MTPKECVFLIPRSPQKSQTSGGCFSSAASRAETRASKVATRFKSASRLFTHATVRFPILSSTEGVTDRARRARSLSRSRPRDQKAPHARPGRGSCHPVVRLERRIIVLAFGLREVVRGGLSQKRGLVPKLWPRRIAVSADASRRRRTISLTRFPGTPIAAPNARAESPLAGVCGRRALSGPARENALQGDALDHRRTRC